MKKPNWLPNWRKVDEYPDPATTTAQEWAWEFLRRNDDYQADYKELVKFQENDDPEINRMANEVINFLYGGPIQFTTATSPLPVAFLMRAYDLLPVMHKEKERYPWIPEVCWRLVAKYNLRCLLDPASPYQRDAFIECDNLPIIETNQLIMHHRNIADGRKLTITLDMDGNLGDQLQYVMGLIGKNPRNRKSAYLNCLRYLDGEGEAPWNIIAKELKLKNKTGDLRDAYDKNAGKAKELRSTGFFVLSQSKLIPGKGNRYKQGRADGKMFFETNMLAPSMLQSLPGCNCVSSNDTVILLKPHLPPSKTA